MIYYLSKKKLISTNTITKIDSVDHILNNIKNEKILTLDTETTGLNFLNNYVIMLQLGTIDGDQYVIDCRDYDLTLFKSILENPKILKIGHNLKFDYNMIKNGKVLLNNIYDTMVADMVIYNGSYNMKDLKAFKKTHEAGRYSLKGVYFHYFKSTIEKAVREEFRYIKNLPFNKEHVIYGAKDVIYPLEIYNNQLKKIEEYDLAATIDLEMKVTLVLGDMEYNGMKISIKQWKKIIEEYETKIPLTEKALDFHLLQQPKSLKYKQVAFQQDLFDSSFEDTKSTIVNWSSPLQVLRVLNNIYKIYPKNKHGKDSSGAEAIMLMPTSTEITSLIERYRKEKKILSSFGENILDMLQKDGRLHTTYNQILATGRISSRSPNLQNMPRLSLFRNAFISEEDTVLSTADFSGQEARVMADQANDKAYIDFFKHGSGDSHAFVAQTMFSAQKGEQIEVPPKIEEDSKAMEYFNNHPNKHLRQKGKTLNFAISFQSSAKSIANRLKIPIEEAQALIDAFFDGFPALREYFNKSKAFGIKNGYIRTNELTKRIRWFNGWKEYRQLQSKGFYALTKAERSTLGKLKGSIERKAANTKIQGTSADMVKYALVFIREKLLENNILPYNDAKVKIIAQIHDEILLEIQKDTFDDELISKYSQIQSDCMVKAGNMFVKQLEMIALANVASYWKH